MTETTTPPPTALRGAVGVWLATAVFGLFTVGYLWIRPDAVREVLRPGGSIADVLGPLTVAALVFGGAYAVFAPMLLRGKRWARGALTATAALHLLWVMLPGVSVAGFITVLMIGIAAVLTWRRSTAHWLKEQ
ncbi:hypothetical protein [Umezawaea sp. Da 62-37]|uniref:hypothetical protein n=1 Tax=Umezawaea sp. Da 62-37 TaxID=3075927 RepID=UPI0028F71600|nr:hypothetical protein [Umezawaea sp. Da 62-37]WNV91034.1 hypothetical protein RM788_22970 [Umezawaea sp. Da 62-37]